jgi:hypothetical protein
MILNEPSHLRWVNSRVQEPAIKRGQICIYAHAVIHAHNVTAGEGYFLIASFFPESISLEARQAMQFPYSKTKYDVVNSTI